MWVITISWQRINLHVINEEKVCHVYVYVYVQVGSVKGLNSYEQHVS